MRTARENGSRSLREGSGGIETGSREVGTTGSSRCETLGRQAHRIADGLGQFFSLHNFEPARCGCTEHPDGCGWKALQRPSVVKRRDSVSSPALTTPICALSDTRSDEPREHGTKRKQPVKNRLKAHRCGIRVPRSERPKPRILRSFIGVFEQTARATIRPAAFEDEANSRRRRSQSLEELLVELTSSRLAPAVLY